MNKLVVVSIRSAVAGAILLIAGVASAHVVVRPNEVGVGEFQTFTVGVPVEREVPTTGVRLVLPEGLQFVSPNVKPGWNIEIKKEGDGEAAKVTEIIWTGGSIPAGQRDEFLFSARVPSQETTVQWKAYQTYQNGDVVSWDQSAEEQAGDQDFSKHGPYSETKVINDLVGNEANNPSTPLILSILALAGSLFSLWTQMHRDQKPTK